MHPYRGMVYMDRQIDGIYTRPDDPKTLTCQYAITNNAPRVPFHLPVTGYSKINVI